MPKILQGSFFRDNRGSKWVEVISLYEDVFERFDVRPPKIIVGLSVTVQSERKFPESVWTFPAALDTGFNRVLEIDERHLERWTGVRKAYLNILTRNQESDSGTFDECGANIWLHRSPYKNPRGERDQVPRPLHLEQSSVVRVMHPQGQKHVPRIPLLGLQALIDNNLQLKLDPRRGTFVLSRTDGLSPLELLAFLGRKRD